MGVIRHPQSVLPVVALIFGDAAVAARALPELEALLGPVAFASDDYAFNFTNYYRDEMGEGLTRRFLAFARPADAAALADWKPATNALEARLAAGASVARPINIDPGYITPAKLVLASTKDFSHRVYLRDGIFAEVTLSYRHGAWVGHETTFPDYKGPTYHGFLARAREYLMALHTSL